MSLTDLVQYVKDLKHTIDNFETRFSRKDVVKGYFVENELGRTQSSAYNSLLDVGFKRTALQIVFPGQTAGLIRKIDPPIEGMDEIHIRFYDDGIISAELGCGRFSLGHYRKLREDGTAELTKMYLFSIFEILAQIFGKATSPYGASPPVALKEVI